MIQKNIREMEPHIRQRYYFAMSAFVRIHGHRIMHDHNITQFCIEWSESSSNAPLVGLNEVDQYFYYEYKSWRGI